MCFDAVCSHMKKCYYYKLDDGRKLFTHYFKCEECGLKFMIETVDERFSYALGTPDWRMSCPNSACKSENVTMYLVEEKSKCSVVSDV